jgi:hypothetical protein
MQGDRDDLNARTAIEYPLRVKIAELEKELATLRRIAGRAQFQRDTYRRMCQAYLDMVSDLDSSKEPA